MNCSDIAESNAVLDSDDDDEMDDIIAEFAAEESNNKNVVKLPESEDEMDDLIREFAYAETESCPEKKTNVPVIQSDEDDDILAALSEEFEFGCDSVLPTENSRVTRNKLKDKKAQCAVPKKKDKSRRKKTSKK